MSNLRATYQITSLQELLDLGDNGIFRMNKIHWRLLKYSDYISNLITKEGEKHFYTQNESGFARLPNSSINNSIRVLISIYESLEQIAEFHKNEAYFKSELDNYKNIQDQADLIKWIEKNEKIGGDEYVCFLLDYLDYAENAEHLSVFFLHAKELDIYIDNADFHYTLKFLETFNKHYWEDDILQKFA